MTKMQKYFTQLLFLSHLGSANKILTTALRQGLSAPLPESISTNSLP